MALACVLAPAAPQAATAPFPARDVRLIVPFPPGGGNDIVARALADGLQKGLGRAIIVDNRGGSGGTVGTDIAAKSPPDGHTLLINNISFAVNATLFPKLPYDTQKDLEPVSIVGHQPSVVAVYPGLKVRSVQELLDRARKTSGGMIYGSGGQGSSGHLATERLLLASGVRMNHVPYKGLAQALADLSTGKVELVIATASTALQPLAAGKVQALAVTTAKRSALFPQLPTMAEAGVRNYEVSTWYAVLVPARTPKTVVMRLNKELGMVTSSAALRDTFASQGLEPAHTTPDEARAYIRSEITKWGEVVTKAGLKP